MMRRSDIKEIAEAVKAYQMARDGEELGQLPRKGVELPDGFKVDENAEEFWADDLLADARDFLREPQEYRMELLPTWYKLCTMRSAATSAAAVRYDRERVQGGQPYGLDSRVLDIIELEQEYERARMGLVVVTNDTRKVLERAGLDKQTTDVWWSYYGKGMSMYTIGMQKGLSKWQVKWMLEKPSNVAAVCMAVDDWRTGVEYYSD